MDHLDANYCELVGALSSLALTQDNSTIRRVESALSFLWQMPDYLSNAAKMMADTLLTCNSPLTQRNCGSRQP